MSAFRKFDPYSFLKNQEAHARPANPAKDAKVEAPALAPLATLAATIDKHRNEAAIGAAIAATGHSFTAVLRRDF